MSKKVKTLRNALETKLLNVCRETPFGLLILHDIERLCNAMKACPIVANLPFNQLFKV